MAGSNFDSDSFCFVLSFSALFLCNIYFLISQPDPLEAEIHLIMF